LLFSLHRNWEFVSDDLSGRATLPYSVSAISVSPGLSVETPSNRAGLQGSGP
jgi:hypothetical protein